MIAVLSRSWPIDTSVAKRMLAAAPHRGSVHTTCLYEKCVLGISNKPDFRLGSISNGRSHAAAFFGLLDNSADLARNLSALHHPPVSTEPADIVAAAFEVFGNEAPNSFRGVFSGVVTDGEQIWCFRDHLGLNPLFYCETPQAFFVAIEAKQIIAGADLPREPDLDVLERIFYGWLPSDMPCAFRGVARLPQGTVLHFNQDGRKTIHRYWHPERLVETCRLGQRETGDAFHGLLKQAVSRSLTGRDIICLSGGIDSPTIASTAAPLHQKTYDQPITALTCVFPGTPAVDESSYVRLIVDFLGIPLQSYQIRARPLDDVEYWCSQMDGPIPIVSIPDMNEEYSLARNLGFRNVLTGELAEFVFAMKKHLLGHLLTHFKFKALSQLIFAERCRGIPWKRIAKEMIFPFVPGRIADAYLRFRGQDWPERVPDWIDKRKVDTVPFRTDLHHPACQRWIMQQLRGFEGATITMEADEICSTLNSITVRRPFTDIDLWEFFLSLPAEIKFPDLGSKTFVRRMMRGKLPEVILNRKDKTVFDDHVMSQIDYPVLRRYLFAPNHRIDGVDYERLKERIEQENFNRFDWFWANELTRIHAFLSLW